MSSFVGQTDCPACSRQDVRVIPPARENYELIRGTDWNWIKRELARGYGFSILVGPDDTGTLIDTLHQCLGFNLVLRVTQPGVVWFCRPEALDQGNDKQES